MSAHKVNLLAEPRHLAYRPHAQAIHNRSALCVAQAGLVVGQVRPSNASRKSLSKLIES